MTTVATKHINYATVDTAKYNRRYNPNLIALINGASSNKHIGVSLEGSSRSGKTYSVIDFLIGIGAAGYHLDVNIIKETFNSFRSTLYRDFSARLNAFGINNPFDRVKTVTDFNIYNVHIRMLGADKSSVAQGAGSDIVWFNEILDVDEKVFDQYTMRISKLWIADYNPYAVNHWYYDKVDYDDAVYKFKSNFRDNPFCPIASKLKILSYEPTPYNITKGTADAYMWDVYGLGKRTRPEGVIYNNVKYVDAFPNDLDYIYCNDFGFTVDPNALIKLGIDNNNIYVEVLAYHPVDNAHDLDAVYNSRNIDHNKLIVADSSDKYVSEDKGVTRMVSDMRSIGYNMIKVSKTKSVMYWIGKVKEHTINFVNNDLVNNAKREVDSYAFKTIAGITINQPAGDTPDHILDALRYGVMAYYGSVMKVF